MVFRAVFWTFVLGLTIVEASSMGDQCDWTGRYVGGTFLFFGYFLLLSITIISV
jgi:hypothetical protein